MRTVFAALALMASTVAASAANIGIISFDDNVPVISIEGVINMGDDVKFAHYSAILETAVVRLSSPGGHTLPALNIGDIIHQKKYWTYVPANTQCASACGMIWLAGNRRMKAETAFVGFHSAYAPDAQGVNREQGLSNALCGAYYQRIGLSGNAIAYITSAGPNEMNWLNQDVAAQFNIPYDTVNTDLVTYVTAYDPPVAAAPVVPVQSAESKPAKHRTSVVPMALAGAASPEAALKAAKAGVKAAHDQVPAERSGRELCLATDTWVQPSECPSTPNNSNE